VAALPVPGEHPGPESREAYAIQVTPGGVNIEGRSSAALYYAAQTLHQHAEASVELKGYPLLSCDAPCLNVVGEPPETVMTARNRRLHCEDGAEAGLALRNALVGLWCLCQWVRLDNRFDFSLR